MVDTTAQIAELVDELYEAEDSADIDFLAKNNSKQKKVSVKQSKEDLSEKVAKLESVKKQLKKEFIGIDTQIDQILDSMRAWYLFPETLNKPLVINLWGITGTFKTSVLRRIIQLLSLSSEFKEIDSRKFNANSDFKELIGYYGRIDARISLPSVFLIDEFQNIRTIDRFGDPTEVAGNLNELFSLLSDGKIVYNRSLHTYNRIKALVDNIVDNRNDVISSIKQKYNETLDAKREAIVRLAPGITKEEIERQIQDHIDTYQMSFARSFINFYSYDLEDFPEFDKKFILSLGDEADRVIDYIRDTFKNVNPDVTLDLRKSLIFIAGNLDNIFGGLTHHLDTDSIDADEFYEASSLANFNDAKNCLLSQFKPEQVSRLGTNHVIFPSFNNKMYKKLVSNLNKRAISSFKDTKVELSIDKSVDEFLVRYTAVPSQGARAILSAHEFVVSSNLSELVTICLLAGAKKGSLSIKNNKLILKANKTTLEKDISIIDTRVLGNYPEPLNSLICTHEASHCIAVIGLLGIYPDLIKVRSSDSNIGGYVRYSGSEIPTKEDMKMQLAVTMAGYAGEYLFIGKDKVSSGASSDIANATMLASYMVKNLGFGDGLSASGFSANRDGLVLNDVDRLDQEVDDLISEAFTLACTVLLFYRKEHEKLTNKLKTNVTLKKQQIKDLLKM